eukprot:m.442818 g.442818  ORF g.442818 m.442818 type:complete len:59 (+) comp18863_c0_seq1:1753-1929(+)
MATGAAAGSVAAAAAGSWASAMSSASSTASHLDKLVLQRAWLSGMVGRGTLVKVYAIR